MLILDCYDMLVANDIITTKTYADNKEIKYTQQTIIHNIKQ